MSAVRCQLSIANGGSKSIGALQLKQLVIDDGRWTMDNGQWTTDTIHPLLPISSSRTVS